MSNKRSSYGSRKRLHLPDCMSVRPKSADCDCGMPLHPLPAGKKLVRIDGRLREVSRSGRYAKLDEA